MAVRGELELTTDNQALKDAIVERIGREGGISFRDFMEMVLYHSSQGYYCAFREKIGREGDYLTSPEVSPVFAIMVARQTREMWDAMGRPDRFQMVEAGAGTGAFCGDLLRWARRGDEDFFAAIEYRIVEVSSALVARQKEALAAAGLADKVHWEESLPDGVEGCIFSNELLDSMPVHRVAVENGRILEIFVTWDGHRFVEEARPPSTEIPAYFQRLGLEPDEGCRAEVNLAAPSWMRQAAEVLRRGFVLTFDYGYEADELYAPWRKAGTLLCFYRHNPSDDPYSRIGRQDMTSHVDFTTIRRAGEESGLTTLGKLSQAEFLTNMGIGEALALPGEGEIDLEGYFARRRAVLELLDPGGLGRIKALVQSNGIADVELSGFAEARRDA